MTMKSLSLTTNLPHLGALLNGSAPDGVTIAFNAPIESRGFDISTVVNVTINVDIDLTKISALVCATWLAGRVRSRNREIDISVNSKQIPKDEPTAIEFIVQEINKKK